MKRLLFPLLLLLSIALAGCATPSIVATGSTVTQAQSAATKTVLSLGEVLVAAKSGLIQARQSGQLTKDQFNQAVDIYNQALASYKLLNISCQAAVTIGTDPTAQKNYIDALSRFLADKGLLDTIMTALGKGN